MSRSKRPRPDVGTSAPVQHLRLLSVLVDAVAGAGELKEIYERALDGLEQALEIERSAVLLLDENKVARFVAWHGLSEAYRQRAEGHFPWPVDAPDPPSLAVPDVRLDASLDALQENLRDEKIRAVAFIPLVYNRVLLGKFMVYYPEPHEFTAEELALARTIGRLIAFAVKRTQVEKDLRDADRRKDEFLATLAHELRNPLAALSTTLDVLALRHGANAERERAISKRQVERLARLLDDLLDVSRITRGLVELRKEPIELSTIVARAVETVRPLLDRFHHDLVVEVPARRILADPARLEQVVSNLLENAAKYTPSGGRITISAASEPDQVVVRVRDTGVGMPPELIPRVFDLFTQGARGLDRSQGGLGIGLTITKNLVMLHGGTIEAFSQGPSKGSEFVVTLPTGLGEQLAPGLAPVEAEPPAPLRAAVRVLLVDDNVDMATSLGEIIRSWGHSVEIETSARAALAAVQRSAPSVILLDIGLPEIDGYELAARFRRMPHLAHTTVIALSGYAADVPRSREVGLTAHLVKPVDLHLLRRLIEHSGEAPTDQPHPE